MKLGLKGWIGLAILAIIFISFTAILLNKPKCPEGSAYSKQANACYVNLLSADVACQLGQSKNLVDGVVSCTFPPTYKIKASFLWMVIGIAALSGIILIVFIVLSGRKPPSDRVMLMPDQAEDLVTQNLVNRLGIPHMEGESLDEIRRKNFRVRPLFKDVWALQNEDKAYRWEIEVLSTVHVGVYTATVNLYSKADEILNGLFKFHPLSMGDVKDVRSKPMELSKSAAERLLASYGVGMSDELREKQKEKIQDQLFSQVTKEPSDEDDDEEGGEGRVKVYKGARQYQRKKPQKIPGAQ